MKLYKNYLKKYGSFAMAQSTSQPICDIFQNNNGSISFINQKRHFFYSSNAMILSHPLSKNDSQIDLITEFLKKYKNASFVQISEPLAKTLKTTFNYNIVPIGEEHIIDLANFKYNWRLRPNLIRYKNKFKKLDFKFREMSFNDEYIKKCQNVSVKWLRQKKHKKEQSFLTRPLLYKQEENVRLFVLEDKTDIAAFLTLDPMYKDDNVYGYMINHIRYHPELPKGSTYALIAHVIDLLQKENITILNLGLAPYEDSSVKPSGMFILNSFLKLLYRQNTLFYNFKGLRDMKLSFKASKQISYIAFKSKLPLVDCYKLYQAFIKGRQI